MHLTSIALAASLALAGPAHAFPPPPREGGAWLGVWLSQRSCEGGAGGEVRILNVIEGSPAERAGLRKGDVIVALDRTRLEDVEDLSEGLAARSPGDTATLRIERDGKEQRLSVVLGERPASIGHGKVLSLRLKGGELKCEEDGKPCGVQLGEGNLQVVSCNAPGEPCILFSGGGPRIGARVEPLSDQLAAYFGAKGGVLVSQVHAGTPAEKAGMSAGDVLTAVNGREIGDPAELGRLLREAGAQTPVRLDAFRRGRALSFDVTPEEIEPATGSEPPVGNVLILRKSRPGGPAGPGKEPPAVEWRSPEVEMEPGERHSPPGGKEI
jgi:membrane-associated protease RseP (regulator of RpoE activity)